MATRVPVAAVLSTYDLLLPEKPAVPGNNEVFK
jgi:hypothetical protein